MKAREQVIRFNPDRWHCVRERDLICSVYNDLAENHALCGNMFCNARALQITAISFQTAAGTIQVMNKTCAKIEVIRFDALLSLLVPMSVAFMWLESLEHSFTLLLSRKQVHFLLNTFTFLVESICKLQRLILNAFWHYCEFCHHFIQVLYAGMSVSFVITIWHWNNFFLHFGKHNLLSRW